MGINGFWRKLSSDHSIAERRVPFGKWIKCFFHENGRFPNIGVDLYGFIFEAVPRYQNDKTQFPEAEDEINSVIEVLLNKIYALIEYNVAFVFVFDGALARGKLRNVGKVDRNVTFEELYEREQQELSQDGHLSKQPLIVKIKTLFDKLQIKYITAPNDAEIELARLNASKEVDAVISNDGDFFIYGGVCLLRNFSRVEGDFPSSAGDEARHAKHFVTPITIQFLNSIGLDRYSMCFIAIASGDDYSNGWKDMGITRAIALANIKLPYSRTLRDIYVGPDIGKYVSGIIQHNAEERLARLNKLITDMNADIKINSKPLFGRAWNSCIPKGTIYEGDEGSPSDFNNMVHFYPLCSNKLFKFKSYTMNSANSAIISNELPVLPQHNSIVGNGTICIRRGDDTSLFGHTDFTDNKFIAQKPYEEYTPSNWFNSGLSELKQFQRRSANPDVLLLRKLAACLLFRMVICLDYLKLDHDDIVVTNFKREGESFSNKVFDEDTYRITVKPEKCLGTFVSIHLAYKDGASVVEDKQHVWVPKYIMESHPNGQYLIERWENTQREKSSKESTPRNRRNTPSQSSTLFNLKKSPFKVSNKTIISPSLDFGAIKVTNVHTLEKRSRSTRSNTEKQSAKKSKQGIDRWISISDIINKPAEPEKDLSTSNFDAFEEDEEISRVLDDDSYIGEIPRQDEMEKSHDDIFFEKKLASAKTDVVILSDSSYDSSGIEILPSMSNKRQDNNVDTTWDTGFSQFFYQTNTGTESNIIINSDSDVETIKGDDL